MEADRSKHAKNLEELRAKLLHDNEISLTTIRSELDIYKEKHLKGHADKIRIYRLVTDVLVDILGNLDLIQRSKTLPINTVEILDRFNRGRMKAYGYLAMLAPQTVMDAMDALMDHMIQITNGQEEYEWHKVRALALKLINEVRKDIGIDKSPIVYRGKL